jgi:4-methyl-5(b-hydroxyethyl)-thiazole monophosphate biosynthesis
MGQTRSALGPRPRSTQPPKPDRALLSRHALRRGRAGTRGSALGGPGAGALRGRSLRRRRCRAPPRAARAAPRRRCRAPPRRRGHGGRQEGPRAHRQRCAGAGQRNGRRQGPAGCRSTPHGTPPRGPQPPTPAPWCAHPSPCRRAGTEEMEAVITIDVLRRAGADGEGDCATARRPPPGARRSAHVGVFGQAAACRRATDAAAAPAPAPPPQSSWRRLRTPSPSSAGEGRGQRRAPGSHCSRPLPAPLPPRTRSRGVVLVADALIADAAGSAYDLVACPGGMPGAERLRDSKPLADLMRAQAAAGKLHAAICATPVVFLQPAGLLAGRVATAHPAFSDKLPDQGPVPRRVVVDGPLTTSRGPGTAFEFALELVKQLYGEDKAREVRGVGALLAGRRLGRRGSWVWCRGRQLAAEPRRPRAGGSAEGPRPRPTLRPPLGPPPVARPGGWPHGDARGLQGLTPPWHSATRWPGKCGGFTLPAALLYIRIVHSGLLAAWPARRAAHVHACTRALLRAECAQHCAGPPARVLCNGFVVFAVVLRLG